MRGLMGLWGGGRGAACVPLWALVVLASWTNARGKSGQHLSLEDISLLKNELAPKCIARNMDGIPKEFTCFFLTEDSDSAFDFFYTVDNPPRRTRCEMQVQRSDGGGFLRVCAFRRSDVFLFDEIPLEVLDRTKNSSLYVRTVSVEDNILLEPPSDVTIIQNDNTGELLLSWQAKCAFTLSHKIRFSSESMNQTVKQGHDKLSEKLDGLVPGEEVRVQVCVRCSPSGTTGHWSHWSPPARAVVPQSADDISLMCSTKDLLNVSCLWDSRSVDPGAGYSLFYKMSASEGPGWTPWVKCLPETEEPGQCGFRGNASRRIRVKLSRPMAPLNRTFYSEDFKLNTVVRTLPPNLQRQNGTDGLCVLWDCPLPALSSQLEYELNYRPPTDRHWMAVSSNASETAVCLKPSWSGKCDVKVRAKPRGPVYSGQWSDWSDVLTLDVPAHSSTRIMLLVHCSPLVLLVAAILLALLFSKYFKKLKRYFWPPVPNLDKVLQDILTDLNQHKWDAPVTAKHLYGETAASVVEVLPKGDDSGLGDGSVMSTAGLSSSDTTYSSLGQEEPGLDRDLCPDYVALNKNTIILCTNRNRYVYEDPVHGEDQAGKGSEESLSSGHSLASDFLNHSYLLTDEVGEKEERGQGNIYTNMPCI